MPVVEVGCFGLMKNPTFSFKTFGMPIYFICDAASWSSSDVIADFTEMPYPDSSFKLVVFDPPHLDNANEDAYMAQKYGTLRRFKWQEDIKKGFWRMYESAWTKRNTDFQMNETRSSKSNTGDYQWAAVIRA